MTINYFIKSCKCDFLLLELARILWRTFLNIFNFIEIHFIQERQNKFLIFFSLSIFNIMSWWTSSHQREMAKMPWAQYEHFFSLISNLPFLWKPLFLFQNNNTSIITMIIKCRIRFYSFVFVFYTSFVFRIYHTRDVQTVF